MRTTLENNRAFGQRLHQTKYSITRQTLTGVYVLSAESSTFQFLNPGGVARTVFLPPYTAEGGALYWICNTGIGTINVVDAGGVAVSSIAAGNVSAFLEGRNTWSGSFDTLRDVRETLLANRVYYVRKDGIDTNNGLLDTSGGAFLTYDAARAAAEKIDTNGFTVTIQVRAGTYAEIFVPPRLVGGGLAMVLGDDAAPSTVEIGGAGFTDTCILVTANAPAGDFTNAVLNAKNIYTGYISGFRLTSSGRLIDQNDFLSQIKLGVIENNQSAGSTIGECVRVSSGTMIVIGPYKVLSLGTANLSVFGIQHGLILFGIGNNALGTTTTGDFPSAVGSSGIYYVRPELTGRVQVNTQAIFTNVANWLGSGVWVRAGGFFQAGIAKTAFPGASLNNNNDGTGLIIFDNYATIIPDVRTFTKVTLDSVIARVDGVGTGATGIKFYKNDATTIIGVWDTTNGRFNIGPNVAPDSLLTLMGNTAATVAPSNSGNLLHMVGADGSALTTTMDAFGDFSQIDVRRANGTLASKTAILSGDPLYNIRPLGWDTSVYGIAGGDIFWATENWSPTAHGSKKTIRLVANTTTANADRFSFWGSGGMSVGSAVVATDPGTDSLLVGGSVAVGAALKLKNYTVAGLPAGVAGDTAYATNCRVFNGAGAQEGAGAGTGGIASHNGTAWKIAGTNITAVA